MKKKKLFSLAIISLFFLISGIGMIKTAPSVQADCCVYGNGICSPPTNGVCRNGVSPISTTNGCEGLSQCGGGGGGGGETQAIHFPNPLEYNTVDELVTSVLDALQGVIVVISIIFIVVGAILYITSTGDENRITMARKAITAAIVGLAIGIAAPSFLHEIAIILRWQSESAATSGALTIAQIALNTLNFLLSVVGVLAIIMLVVAGIMYLTAAGDEQRIDTAKSMTKWSIIGIAIALGSLIIVRQVAHLFIQTGGGH